jgi:membrane-bound lytic murein transglycosylase B
MNLLTRILLTVFLVFSPWALAQAQSFVDWLEELRAEARQYGISDQTISQALGNLRHLERVLELDRSQPEFVQTFTHYTSLRISNVQIERGKALLQEHASLLREVQRKYGVQPQYLVSFWALESNFGRATGGFSVVEALATLAYDPRRASFFRQELLTALSVIDAGHIAADRMTGSWAGAMGQLQFMPSTFDNYAVDGDGDGKIDIWNSLPDVFHSAGNFLSASGWRGDERWGREVRLPANFDFGLSGTEVRKPVVEWSAENVTQINGQPLPMADLRGSIVIPAGATGPAFLVYNNFRTTMVWNRSVFYAIAVGHLADRFTGSPPIQNMPVNEQALSRNDVIELQQILQNAGYYDGSIDGIMGSGTRGAVRQYQQSAGLPMDGYASYLLLERLRSPQSN